MGEPDEGEDCDEHDNDASDDEDKDEDDNDDYDNNASDDEDKDEDDKKGRQKGWWWGRVERRGWSWW